jgi:hypothetical protein
MRQMVLVQQGSGLNIRVIVVFSHPPSTETLTRYGIYGLIYDIRYNIRA